MFRKLWQSLRGDDTASRLRDTKDRVDRFGWTAIYVGDYQTAPTWAYTIGFHRSLGAPEVVVFDVPQDVANGLFHEIYKDLKSGALVIRDGEEWRPGAFEHPLVWREVHSSRLYDNDPENAWLGLAEDFATVLAPQSGPIRAVQLVMSDPHGRMPWEAGYDESLRHLQRELWEPVERVAVIDP
jgi:hypothetical protein